ncbi:MAG: hypothetical protein WD872_09395 [Pirellulaceae bacterium]
MTTLPATRRLAWTARSLAALSLLLAGCQFPAIDPTGQQIFSGNSTSIAHHDLLGGLLHHQREPAAAAASLCAPPQPVAVGPIVAIPVNPLPVVPFQPVACTAPGAIRQTPLPPPLQITRPACASDAIAAGPILRVTPARIVAPIHTEVVLAAGMTDGQGYYVMRQPIEWMLAQDGVGQVMAVGKESPLNISHLLRHSPQKVATDYVRAHTSTIAQTLDRGTPGRADDVYLEKGQSWITVSSPTEGTSHVTVWAPQEQTWERRQATATIYWVDAVWQFPPPAAARAGEKQVLTTVVNRSGGAPVAGWIVRYEVLEGPAAVFSARGDTALEVRTDAAGRATVELLPRAMQPGITTVGIQVIRPATGRGDLPQMVVGQGQTAVSWSTPGLAVTAVGPSTVAADGAVSYRVEVTNNGDLPTPGVKLSYTPPAGVTVLNSTPAAQAFGQRFEWRIGDLPARTTSVVELNCRAAVAADIRSCFRAASSDRLSAEGCATTRVFANALSVKMTGPEAVEVGSEAKFLIDITNTGAGTLTNIVASDTFDPGLTHAQGEPSPLRRALDQSLAPGETYRMAISLVVTQPGRHSHRLDVTADGGQTAGARAVVTGTAAAPIATPPQLSVRVTGPRTQRAGDVGQFFVEVANAGSSPATGVQIDVRYGISLDLVEATRGHQDDPQRRSTRWSIAELAGGETIRRQLNLRGLNADESGAFVSASVVSDQTRVAPVSDVTQTILTPGVARPPVPPTTTRPPADPPVAGRLKVTIGDLFDPIMLGGKTTYIVTITNESTAADQEVMLSLQLADGLEFIRATGPTGVAASLPNGIELAPIAEIRPGETLAPYRIEVSGLKAGTHAAQVQVTSSRLPTGATAQTDTTVNMP